MNLAAQRTPLIAALEQLGPHDHFCSIYENREEHYGGCHSVHADRAGSRRKMHLHRRRRHGRRSSPSHGVGRN